MNALEKTALSLVILSNVVLGFTSSGCAYSKNKSPESLSRQDRGSVAAIERREVSGDLSAHEAAIEKNAYDNGHRIKF
jgi:hypothetical protein